MTSARFDIDKFTGKNDFGIWRLKMRALLVHQGLEDALEGDKKLSESMSGKEKKGLLDKAHSALILSSGDSLEGGFEGEICCGNLAKIGKYLYDQIFGKTGCI